MNTSAGYTTTDILQLMELHQGAAMEPWRIADLLGLEEVPDDFIDILNELSDNTLLDRYHEVGGDERVMFGYPE